MHYAGLKPYAKKYHQLEPLFLQLDKYLKQASEQEEAYRTVVPALLAEKLDVVEEVALLLLHFAHKAHILEPTYVAYSPKNNWLLGEFRSKDRIPEVLYSAPEDVYYSINEYYVELLFRFKNRKPGNPKIEQ